MASLIAGLQNKRGTKSERSIRLINACPELPDDTFIAAPPLPPRIKNALLLREMRTVGEVRIASDKDLLQIRHLGKASIEYLRCSLGLPSSARR
jgi:DNA-directed RNA polymerase alpha subunit